jgi:hypothetical protein
MSVFLNRINSAPIMSNDFPYEFNQWIFNLIDSLNNNFDNIDNVIVSQSLLPTITSAVDVTTNSLYIPTNAALVTFQLPVVTAEDIGSIVEITGFGAGGWSLVPGSGATIKVSASSAATSLSSSSRYDSIRIILVDATTWVTMSSQTSGFVIV